MGTFGEAVLTSTHNLCFGAKIRKISLPLQTPVLLYKSGVQGGIHCTRGHVFLMGYPYTVVLCLVAKSVSIRPVSFLSCRINR